MKNFFIACSLFVLAAFLAPAAQADCGSCGSGEAKASGKEHKDHKMDVVDLAAHNSDFTTLVKAIKAAGLMKTLKGDGPFTVFAPTNEAFAKLGDDTLKDLLKPENKEKLASILKYHVVSGKVMADDAMKLKNKGVKTVQGTDLTVNGQKSGVTVNNAKVVKTDLKATNGVIHVIDTVVMPKG